MRKLLAIRAVGLSLVLLGGTVASVEASSHEIENSESTCAPAVMAGSVGEFISGGEGSQPGNFFLDFVATSITAPTATTSSYAFTSGTSGCGKEETAYLVRRQEHFVLVNYHKLMEDIAQGGGEHFLSLANLLGGTPAETRNLAKRAQDRFGRLFPPAGGDSRAVLLAIKRILGNLRLESS